MCALECVRAVTLLRLKPEEGYVPTMVVFGGLVRGLVRAPGHPAWAVTGMVLCDGTVSHWQLTILLQLAFPGEGGLPASIPTHARVSTYPPYSQTHTTTDPTPTSLFSAAFWVPVDPMEWHAPRVCSIPRRLLCGSTCGPYIGRRAAAGRFDNLLDQVACSAESHSSMWGGGGGATMPCLGKQRTCSAFPPAEYPISCLCMACTARRAVRAALAHTD